MLSLAEALDLFSQTRKYNKVDYYYPKTGRYSKDKYNKQREFFRATSTHSRVAFIAGNRVGKTFAGAYLARALLTGKYPEDWEGKRFDKPINAWIAGVTTAAMRDGIQELLFGNFADMGTGMFSKDDLTDHDGSVKGKGEIMTWAMPGQSNCVGTCLINHVSGGKSKIEFKTYDQGWEKFQSAKRQFIWLDEEPSDPKIYSECATRTGGDVGEEGLVVCTFTPLHGMSSVVMGFMPGGKIPPNGVHPEQPHKKVVFANWDNDAPHLSNEWKKQALQEYDPSERDARSKGIPAMGSGRIYPIDEEFITCDPIKIPEYWPRVYGLDFGWHNTAVIWIAEDPSTHVRYLYSEYKRGKVAPYVHVNSIQAKGKWIPGIADPSGGGRSAHDGTQLIDEYISLGLRLTPGDNSFNTGIARVLNAMESGTFQVFRNCTKWLDEFRVYRYDIKDPNKPARNQDDHLLDATRYAFSLFDSVARSEEDEYDSDSDDSRNDSIDRSRDDLTGY